MATVNKTVQVRVVTLDPATGTLIPVPNAALRCKNSEWLWDGDLSDGSHTSDADGRAAVVLSFEEGNEAKLNPYFVISIPDGSRQVPAGAPAARRVSLPDSWETRHAEKRRIRRLDDYADPARPLELLVGLPAHLRLAYSDFDPSGVHNPLALPAGSARVYLADYDEFFFIDFLNPDDTMTGFGYDPAADRIIPVGENDSYAFFDTWPTAPSAFDGLPAAPRAWLDQPGAPVGSLGGGSFVRTGALAVDPHGFVFVGDGNLVRRFYPDGTLCETIGLPGTGVNFNNPGGLAVDQYRNLFVANTGSNEVFFFQLQYFDGGSGTYIFAGFVNSGTAGPFGAPGGLAVMPNRVVDGEELLAVCDTTNARVQVFRITITTPVPARSSRSSEPYVTVGLAPLTALGSASVFASPVGVAADRQRRLYVCDFAQHKVSRWLLDATGLLFTLQVTFEKAGGGAGAGAGEFTMPTGLALDTKSGYLYVAELGNQRVQRLDAETGANLANWTHTYTPALANPFTPGTVATDARGEVYAADMANFRVLRGSTFDAAGAPLPDNTAPRIVGSPWTPVSEAPHMAAPGYVTLAPDGRLWVADSGNNRVLRFARDGAGALTVAPDVIGAAAGLSGPVGIAVASDGAAFVADSVNDRIVPFNAAQVAQAPLGSSGSGDNQFDDPRGIALVQRTEALIYVADRANNRVQIIKPDGSFTGRLTGGGGTNLSAPEDVAVDRAGNLFVADTGNQRIVQYDAADVFVRVIVPVGTGFSLQQPSGVAVDGEGKLIVADRQQRRVYRMDTAGAVLAMWDLRSLTMENTALAPIYPELARQQVLQAPARALLSDRGLLMVADTGNDRVRLVRVFTGLDVVLFDLGEDLPDISCRVITKVDARAELGLELNVGDVSIFDDSHDFESDPADDFSDDRFRFERILGPQRTTNGAIHTATTVRGVQRWYQQYTSTDEAGQRWGVAANSRTLDVDLIGGDNSYQFLDVNLGMDSPHGQRSDAWDPGVIAHEMTHWVYGKAIQPYPPYSLAGLIELSSSHTVAKFGSYNLALSEGWAEYVAMFWERDYGSYDRVRGMRNARAGQTFPGVSESGRAPYRYIFGGPASDPLPSFQDVNVGLQNEGCINMALYQIHHILADPGVLFADAPSFWHRHNAGLSDAQRQRFVDVIWKTLRRFELDPPLEEIDKASLIYLRNLLDQAHVAQAAFAPLVQSIYELNNILMPSVRIFVEGNQTALGDELALPAGSSRSLVVRVRDATQRPLRGYNLRFRAGAVAQFALAGGAGPVVRHGRRTAALPTELQRATSASGEVTITYTAPAGGAGTTETLRVSYQPDFDTDEHFEPPTRGDDRETTLRKLYMYELRSAAKTWAGTGNNFGAEVVKTLRLKVT